MAKLLLKGVRYLKCYGELTFGGKPKTIEGIIDYCVDRPVLMTQVRSEAIALGKLLQERAPTRSLEIGTNYGGTLFLLCHLSSPQAKIISVDLPSGPFGGGYPKRKIPLFRKFRKAGQQLHLIRANSHLQETKDRVLRILDGQLLDYLFLDGDHTYEGVRRDFEMYGPLVRKGGMIALHDIASHDGRADCRVDKFWDEIRREYRHQEIVESPSQGWAGLGVLFVT